jgi:hypothetical protein
MVASWSISEEKYPQKNQGTAGLEPATFSFNCHLQARLTSALLLPNVKIFKRPLFLTLLITFRQKCFNFLENRVNFDP